MRRYIFASHHYLAYGLKDTVDFLTNKAKHIYALNAYCKEEEADLEEQVKELFASFQAEDEVLVLTDMFGGSVYQKFYPYISDRVHVICGMNLPMAMSFLLMPEDEVLSEEAIQAVLEDCRKQLVYVNPLRMASTMDKEDE